MAPAQRTMASLNARLATVQNNLQWIKAHTTSRSPIARKQAREFLAQQLAAKELIKKEYEEMKALASNSTSTSTSTTLSPTTSSASSPTPSTNTAA